jgi:hypothetical protein
MKVRFHGVVRSNGRDRLSATLDPPIDGESELWFELRRGEIELLESADPFALALVPLAASRGCSLEIDGPLSPSLLFHLDEVSRFLEMTTRGDPRHAHCQVVPLSAASLVERTRPDPRAAVAGVSGGIDATYTLARHRFLLPSDARLDLRRAVFVHGLDISLADEETFQEAVKRVERITEAAATPLVLLATNFKELGPDWELSTGAAGAAALTCVSDGLGTGLRASTAPYEHMDEPWGRAPYLDHLFSSASFEIVYDGAAANRLDKVRALAETWPEVVPELRFCTRPAGRGGNCGACLPCVLTFLMFSLCGSARPTNVDPPTTETAAATLRTLPIRAFSWRIRLLVDEADRLGVRPAWYRVAKRRLRDDRLRRAVSPYVPEAANRVRRSLRRFRAH